LLGISPTPKQSPGTARNGTGARKACAMTIRANASQASKNFTRQIFAWLRQVKNDHTLQPSAALLALQLTEHFNRRLGGAAWASCETLAAGVGMGKTTAVRLLHEFERRGHLKVEWGKQGRGHSNQYWMLIKGPSADLLSEPKRSIKRSTGGEKRSTDGPEPSYNYLKEAPTELPLRERERDQTLSRLK
jgi:hypothetical protein